MRIARWLAGPAVLAGWVVAPPAGADADEVAALKARVAQPEAEVRDLRGRLARLEGAAGPARPGKITVVPGGWGDADPEDIEAVCRSAAAELLRHFPAQPQDPITVRSDPKQGPMVIFGRGPGGERRVLLSAKDRYWGQFAYQFAHELCHIQCNYREGHRANLWFEESLCEAASLFVLRRLAETWKTAPPYPNWKGQAASLGRYAEQRLKDTEKLDGLTLARWYERNEPELRRTGTDRARNRVVAATLLPLLEKDPRRWGALAWLNQGDGAKELSFREYLRDWHGRVPAEHRGFVAEVAGLFGVAVE